MGTKAKTENSEQARPAERDDLGAIAAQAWFQKKIEEGLASPIVGPLTRERVEQLVSEGIERAKRRRR